MKEQYIVPKAIIRAGKLAEDCAVQGMPIGINEQFIGEHIPKGFLAADGRVLFVKEYPELAEVIGGAYMDTVYTREIKHWWVFRWTTYKQLDLVKEYGIFRLPKVWHAQFTCANPEKEV